MADAQRAGVGAGGIPRDESHRATEKVTRDQRKLWKSLVLPWTVSTSANMMYIDIYNFLY